MIKRLFLCSYFIAISIATPFSLEGQRDTIVSSFEMKMDSLINAAIDSLAFPGCQLWIGRRDEIILYKSYGYATYNKKQEVRPDHLYDLASLTKVTSGLLLLMKMVEAELIDLDTPIKKYLPQWKKGNKKNLTLRQILAHQGGLQPYLVFWQDALKEDGTFRKNTFSNQKSKNYSIAITDNLFLHKSYYKKMWKAIQNSDVVQVDQADYKYSGLFFLMIPALIENVLKTKYLPQLEVNIYKKMNLKLIGYEPKKRFEISQIIPTEIDTFFRKDTIHGYVHDEAAAMLNNHSCNAGVFSNASDVATIFQMLMNKGLYNDKRILDQNVVSEFTSYQYPTRNNRRGLGFDKPLLEYNSDHAYISKSASESSFGHSGFTGTFVWADPEKDLLIVLLSNRVYPSRLYRNLYRLNIRPQIHQLCYDYFATKY